MKLYTLCGALALSLLSSTMTQAAHIKLAVKENKVACYGNEDGCLLIKTEKALDWNSLAENISGFEYEAGYKYLIVVDKTLKKGSKNEYDYKFVKLLQKTAVALPPDESFATIQNKKWHLNYFMEQDASSEGISIEIFNDKIAIKGVCNNYFTRFTPNATTLSTGIVSGTMKACINDKNIEDKFAKSFENKHLTYTINDNHLLFYNRGKHVMTFTDQLENKEIDQLSKYEWHLYKYDTTLFTDRKIIANINFDAKTNKINGNDGCNGFFGTYEVLKNTITFKGIATTMRACLDQDRNNLSAQFNRLFNTQNLTFTFNDNRLYLNSGDKTIFIFEGKPKK